MTLDREHKEPPCHVQQTRILFPQPFLPLVRPGSADKPHTKTQKPHMPPNGSLDTISGTFNFAFAILFNFPSHPFYAELPIYATPKHTRDSEQIRRKLQGFHLHWLQFPLEFATGTIVHLPAAQKVHRKQAITHCFPFPLTFSIFVRHY